MAFPGASKPYREQLKEANGQPLPIGAISDGQLVRRSGITLLGVNTLANIRFSGSYLEILNETDGLYYQIRCRNDLNGFAELFLSDAGSA